jgi:hypothetical protein
MKVQKYMGTSFSSLIAKVYSCIPLNLFLFFILFTFLSFPEILFAKVVELFLANGDAVENYLQKIDSIESGDSVQFSDGSLIKIDRFLGSGTQTAIFSLKDNPELVIRIPRPSQFKTLEQVQAGLSSYVEGYHSLERFDVPHVKILAGLKTEYLMVNKIPETALSLDKFLNESVVESVDRKKASKALVHFMIKSAGFGIFGDFNPSQLRYDSTKDQWQLIDWDNHHDPAFEIETDGKVGLRYSRTPMIDDVFREAKNNSTGNWIEELHNLIRKEVLDERLRILQQNPDLALEYVNLSELKNTPINFSHNGEKWKEFNLASNCQPLFFRLKP